MAEIESRINGLVETLMEDYSKDRVIDEIKLFEHPDKEAVVDILEKLRKIIYPGYFRNKSYKIYTVRNNISMLLEDVIYNLSKQIALVLKYEPQFSGLSAEEISIKAEELTFDFLDKIPKIREYIETDVQAFFDGDPAA